MYDIIIKNAYIADGTGEKSFKADIGIKGDIIAEILPQIHCEAGAVIEADGLTAMPGIIDMHRHGELSPIYHAGEGEEIRQGITTFFSGNCGFSAYPSCSDTFKLLQDYASPIIDKIPDSFSGYSFAQFAQELSKHDLSSNMGFLAGNGTLRIAVKGFDNSPLTAAEMQNYKSLLRESFEQGVFGLSLGLMYAAENSFLPSELCQIASVAAKASRPVFVHMRGEGSSLLASIDEVIAIAEKSGARMHISHLKAAGKKNWNVLVDKALERIEAANSRSLEISFDCYPYNAGSTAMYTLLPPWVQSNGIKNLIESLNEPETRRRVIKEMENEAEDWDNLVASTGWQNVVIAGGNEESFIGKSISEVSGLLKKSSEETCIDLITENHADIPIVFYSMDERDIRKIIMHPDAVIISDGLYSPQGNPHPRRYGSFAKAVKDYSENKGFEAIVAAMTKKPADIMGLRDRGVLKKGKKADILLINREKYSDKATYKTPKLYPEGIEYVIINGKAAIEKGSYGRNCYGKVLKNM